MSRIVILSVVLAAACGAPKPERGPVGGSAPLSALPDGAQRIPPSPAPDGAPALVMPGPGDLGAYYVVAMDKPVHVRASRETYSRRSEAVITVPECSSAPRLTAIVWPRDGEAVPTIPPEPTAAQKLNLVAGGAAQTVAAPAGSWVAIRLDGTADALPCLAAVYQSEPIEPGREYWCQPTLGCADMAHGGGSPQCSGPCPWYSRLDRGDL